MASTHHLVPEELQQQIPEELRGQAVRELIELFRKQPRSVYLDKDTLKKIRELALSRATYLYDSEGNAIRCEFPSLMDIFKEGLDELHKDLSVPKDA